MHTVIDNGPPEPMALEADPTEQAKIDHAALVRAHKDWHEANKEPRLVQMHAIDANAAVSSGPDRFSLFEGSPLVHKAGSIDDRMSAVEERLNFFENGGEYEEAPYVEGRPRSWRRKPVKDAPARTPLDKGPAEPGVLDVNASPQEKERHAAAVKAREEWNANKNARPPFDLPLNNPPNQPVLPQTAGPHNIPGRPYANEQVRPDGSSGVQSERPGYVDPAAPRQR
jgi:hypothetical protein